MDWELKERSKKCESCRMEFQTGDHYKSALYLDLEKLKKIFPEKEPAHEDQSSSLFYNSGERIELCPQCWEKVLSEKNYDSQWLGKVPPKKEEKPDEKKFNRQNVVDEFRKFHEEARLTGSEEERIDKSAIAYFLAVMLERKSILSFKKDIADEETGARCALYVMNKTKEEFKLFYPLLTVESIKHYQEVIFNLLGIEIKQGRKKKVQEQEPAAPVKEEAGKAGN